MFTAWQSWKQLQTPPMFSVVVNDDKRWKQAERWLMNHGIQVTSQGIKLCGQQILEFQTDNWIDVNLGLEMLSYIESTPESNSVREMLMGCEYALPPVKV